MVMMRDLNSGNIFNHNNGDKEDNESGDDVENGDDGSGDDDEDNNDFNGDDNDSGDNSSKVREMARAKMFGRPGNGAPTG